MNDCTAARERMVERQLAGRGISDPRVLDAFRAVPRELFVSDELRDFAYDDSPLPIGAEQTISQPYIVALMLEAARIEPGARVLEIGAGSGYAAALLGQIAAKVIAIERHASLARAAEERIRQLRLANVRILAADGSEGWPEEAPYDAILFAAAGPVVPPALLRQLALGGTLVMPLGGRDEVQRLIRIIRHGEEEFERDDLGAVRFVPLIGVQGFDGSEDVTR